MRDGIALIDWDNTIRAGWTVRDWAEYLEDKRLVSPQTSTAVHILLKEYAYGRSSYEQMADAVPKALAVGLKGQSKSAVDAQALSFVERDGVGIFPFAKGLFAALTERNLSVAVVSGAPEDVLRAASNYYGFSGVHGTTFETAHDRYLGTVEANRATKQAKREIVETVFGSHTVCLAAGDSEADLPLLERAKVKLVVGNRKLADQMKHGVFVNPESRDISSILLALDQSCQS